jgi:hypothetical protein
VGRDSRQAPARRLGMSRNIPWSEDDDQQLRSLALSGFSLAEITHQMVLSKSPFAAEKSTLRLLVIAIRCESLSGHPPAR